MIWERKNHLFLKACHLPLIYPWEILLNPQCGAHWQLPTFEATHSSLSLNVYFTLLNKLLLKLSIFLDLINSFKKAKPITLLWQEIRPPVPSPYPQDTGTTDLSGNQLWKWSHFLRQLSKSLHSKFTPLRTRAKCRCNFFASAELNFPAFSVTSTSGDLYKHPRLASIWLAANCVTSEAWLKGK